MISRILRASLLARFGRQGGNQMNWWSDMTVWLWRQSGANASQEQGIFDVSELEIG